MRKLLLFCGILGLAIAIAGCSGSNNTTPAVQMSGVLVHISDPATCSATHGGSFTSVFATFSDVQIHTNPSAGPNDGGWVDLTPNLKNHPIQVDLLSEADTSCFLATLGDRTEIQPGTFQQIRLILADKSQAANIIGAGANGANACAAVQDVNCVVPTVGSPMPLKIPSGLQTGIKIPSGQIAGGQFTVPPGQAVDLDIDVLTCQSIVLAGNQALFKPVLHAGEVSQQKATINGKVVDNAGHAVSGAVVMLVEHNPPVACSGAANCVSNAAIEQVVMEEATDASGNFVFCPILGGGPFDVIAIAVNNGTTSATTVVASVPVGSTLTGANTVKLVSAGVQATIKGTVTTTSASTTPIAEQGIKVAALQAFTAGGTNLLLAIPTVAPFSTVTTVDTVTPNNCTPNTAACGNYSLLVPAGNPNVGVFNVSGTTFSQALGDVNYIVDAQTSSCTPSEEQTNTQATMPPSTLKVTAGGTVTASTLAFSSCQ